MSKFKIFLLKLKKPSILLSVIFSILALSVIALTIVWVCLWNTESFFCYIMYVISALSLTYFVYIIVYFAPKIKHNAINLLKKYKFTSELLKSYGYRSVVFAIWSFIINIAFAVVQAVFAILSHSVWYWALAIYYTAISLIRGGLVVVSRKKKRPEIDKAKSYRNCGIYLLFLNLSLVAAIVQMVLANQSFKYAGIMIYIMATYTFYKLGLSIYHLIKAKKQNDFTIQSIKNISFADALVSLLALQTALLQAFSQDYIPYLPNSLSGGAFSMIIIALGIYMIVRGNSTINQLKSKQQENNLNINEQKEEINEQKV